VRVVAETRHRLRLALDPLSRRLVETLGLDERDGNVPVEARVVREVDALAPALAEEALDHVASARDLGRRLGGAGAVRARGGSRNRLRGLSRVLHGFPLEPLAAARAETEVRRPRPAAVRAFALGCQSGAAVTAEVGVVRILVAARPAGHEPSFACGSIPPGRTTSLSG